MVRQEKIRDFRRKARFSQTEFAKMIGVSRNQLANYEGGRSEPDDETWRKFLDLEKDWDLSMSDLELDYPSLKYLVRALKEDKREIALAAIKELVEEIEKKRLNSDQIRTLPPPKAYLQ